MAFNGVNMGLGNIMKLSSAVTRSITAENVYGEKGRGGMAEVSDTPQRGVKRSASIWERPEPAPRPGPDVEGAARASRCRSSSTTTLMDVDGPGVIQHIWITVDPKRYRDLILRMYWDGEDEPSVEVPVGDFFCNGWKTAPTCWRCRST